MPRYFLDTSALVKRYHQEIGTPSIERIFEEPAAEFIISRLTLVETLSVFAIKVRTGEFDAGEFTKLRKLFSSHVTRRSYQVSRLLNVHYDSARNLIIKHGPIRQIRTLDALQLAVALDLHQTSPIKSFVCADRRLCVAAIQEGLDVLNPDEP